MDRGARAIVLYPQPNSILNCAFGSMKNVPSSASWPSFSQLQRMLMCEASLPFRRPARLVYLEFVEEEVSKSRTNCADTQLVGLAESQRAITGILTGMSKSAAFCTSTMNANRC